MNAKIVHVITANAVVTVVNKMVTTTQLAKKRKKKGVETILVDYK